MELPHPAYVWLYIFLFGALQGQAFPGIFFLSDAELQKMLTRDGIQYQDMIRAKVHLSGLVEFSEN